MSDNVINDRKYALVHDFIVNHKYEVRVRAVGLDGTQQAMEDAAHNTIVIKGKLAVPNTPTTLTATGYMNAIGLVWANPLDYDFDKMEIWRDIDYDGLNRAKIAEVRGITYIDTIGSANATRFYWIRAVNTSGKTSGYYPLMTGVSATTLGIVATDIDDFAITATKMFTKTVILSADSWTNNSPGAGLVAWNAHSIVYNGIIYPIAAGNTALAYIYWTIGSATYSTSATHPTLGTTAFMIAINTAGIHTLVWNSSANMVIGSAFIANLAVTDAKIANATITSAKIALATITDANISSLNVNKVTAGTLTVGYTQAKCTDALADQTSANKAADTAKTQGSTLIVGGYIDTGFITCDNIDAGTLTGRTVQTATANQRIVLSQADNTLRFHTDTVENVIRMDDNLYSGGPAIWIEDATHGCAVVVKKNDDNYSVISHSVIVGVTNSNVGKIIMTRTVSGSGVSGIIEANQGGGAGRTGNLFRGIANSVDVFTVNASGNIYSAGNMDAVTYKVNGAAGANFNGAVTNITVVDGLVTAVS